MRVVITTAGSRGDLQPYVALGQALARAGHDVVLATHGPYEAFVREHGLGFRPIAGDPLALLQSPEGLAWLDARSNPIAFVRRCHELLGPLVEEMFTSVYEAIADADAVVYAPLTSFAHDFAEARGVPAVLAGPVPLSATAEFPFVIMPPGWPSLGPLNVLSHQAVLLGSSLGLRGTMNRWRARLDLPPLPFGPLSLARQARLGALYGFSEHVVPRPRDWGPGLIVTGYWFLDPPAGWEPPRELSAFLEAGPPPVYVGFGSMADREPARLVAAVQQALARVGARGVLLDGWGGLGRFELPETIQLVRDVPHAWLFPRMAAVVHHGGAGTTAAAIRAGVPAVVTPYFADQPFWANRIHALGAGPLPVPRESLTADAIARALRSALENPRIRSRAAELGRLVRAEDGLGNAVAGFQHLLGLSQV